MMFLIYRITHILNKLQILFVNIKNFQIEIKNILINIRLNFNFKPEYDKHKNPIIFKLNIIGF